jgi:hypothetical protein
MSVGYSGTPLWRKLGYTDGTRARLDGAPPGYDEIVDPLPGGVRFLSDVEEEADLVHLFVTSRAELGPALVRHMAHLAPRGALWVSWPKRAAKVDTDMTEQAIRDAALPLGLVDVKVCAVDETWSGLKLVRRLTAVSSP